MTEHPRQSSVREGAAAYAVRMDFRHDQPLGDLLPRMPEDVQQRVADQLWLRAILLEQRRRTRIAERPMFDARADRILELLDPPEDESEALDRANYALCRFIFPGYIVPRSEMAQAVLDAAAGGADWQAKLPARRRAIGEGPEDTWTEPGS